MSAATLITMVSLVPPWLTGYVLDKLVAPAKAGTLPVSRAALLAWLTVSAMAVIYLLRQAAAVVRLRLMAIMGEWVARDLRTELYEHLQSLSLSFFSRKKTGSLITRVSADTDRLWDFLAFGVVDVSLSAVMLIGLGAVLVVLDWRLGLAMVLPVPLFCWMIFRHGESMNRVFLRAWRKWSRVSDVLSDTIPGIRVVKAFHQEEREIERFTERNEDVTAEFNRIHRMWTTFWPMLVLGVHASTMLVWVLAVPRLLGTVGTGAVDRNLRRLPAVRDDVHGADRSLRPDRAHHEPRHHLGAPGVRGAGHRARGHRPGRADPARAGRGQGELRARDVRLRRRSPGDSRA